MVIKAFTKATALTANRNNTRYAPTRKRKITIVTETKIFQQLFLTKVNADIGFNSAVTPKLCFAMSDSVFEGPFSRGEEFRFEEEEECVTPFDVIPFACEVIASGKRVSQHIIHPFLSAVSTKTMLSEGLM
jgi:hypothetical protein